MISKLPVGAGLTGTVEKERISSPKSIQVAIVSPAVTIENDGRAIVSFKQIYRSSTLKTSTRKTLVMVKSAISGSFRRNGLVMMNLLHAARLSRKTTAWLCLVVLALLVPLWPMAWAPAQGLHRQSLYRNPLLSSHSNPCWLKPG